MAAVHLAKEHLPSTNTKTRFQEQIRLKELKSQKGLGFTKRLNNIFSGKRKYLSYRHYIIIVFSFQLRCETIIAFVHWTLHYGAVNMFVGYCIITAIFEMPLMLLFTFLGMYCRKTIIGIWDCLPVMKGVAISVLLLITFDNVLDASYASLASRYLFDIFSSPLPWFTCNFRGATEFCYVPFANFTSDKYNTSWEDDCCGLGYEFDNCVEKLPPPQSAAEFLRYNKEGYNVQGEDFRQINFEWALSVGIFWTIIYFSVLLGMEKMKFFIVICSVCACIFPVFIYLFIALRESKVYNETRLIIRKSPLFDKTFWMHIVNITTKCATPGFLVYVASLAPDDADPLKTTVLTTIFRATYLSLGFLGVPSFIGGYLEDFNAPYKCVGGRGRVAIFAMGTHLISIIPGHVLILLLWFTSITFQCVMLTLAHVLAAIDSLADGIPYFSKHRTVVTFVFVAVSYAFNCLVATAHRYDLFFSLRKSSLIIVQMIIFSLSLIGIVFIYGAHRLKNDYHFAFNRPISNYWIMLWKIDAILSLTFLFFMVESARVGLSEETYKIANYIVLAVTISPIIVCLLWKYYKCLKYQDLSSFFKSSAKWAYYQHRKARFRKIFNPNKQKYKNVTLKCQHRCLTGSVLFKKELVRQESMLQIFSTKHNVENADNFKFD
ncbi:sodium-dependent dopamine transporter-like [Agrilus planipennis]|uniref:Sodium-dependent dopamine transporter-like n=1 Tax=Agrilus planipennis TaxID=224129 RepID=A0A1W4XMS8_AGRPL|nr:sodium-dependent dopamine transporter-like [Agrilus planipennis]